MDSLWCPVTLASLYSAPFSELASCLLCSLCFACRLVLLDGVNCLYLVWTSFSCSRFSENVMDKPGFVDVYPASRVPRNLRHHFKSVYRFNSGSFEKQSNQFGNAKQKGLRIVTDSENLSSALRCISDEEVSMSCSTCKTSGTFIDPICLSQIKMHDSIEQCLNFLCHHPLSLLIDSITLSVTVQMHITIQWQCQSNYFKFSKR